MDPTILVLGALTGSLAGWALTEFAAFAFPSWRSVRTWLEPLRRASAEGYAPTPAERRRLAALASIGFPIAALAFLGPVPAPLAAASGPAAAAFAVRRRRRGYRRQVEADIPLIADACADALTAGQTLRAALAGLHGSLSGPAAVELARVAAELELGAPTRTAVERLRGRTPGGSLEELCTILGSGSLGPSAQAGLLRTHSRATLEAMRAGEEARSATAQARFTGILVAAMPAGTLLVAELLEPGFLRGLLSHPVALGLCLVAGVLQGVGFFAISRLARVET